MVICTIVKYLVGEQGCNPSSLDDLGWTPLHFAATSGHIDIVKFFALEKHCDPMLQDGFGYTVLCHAVARGHLEIVNLLIERLKCSPDIPGLLNVPPLQMAIMLSHC